MKRIIAGLAALLFVTFASAQVPAAPDQPPQARSAREKPKDFGTSNFYTALDAYALQPYNANFINARTQNSSTGNLNCSGASTESRAVGQINLPHGVDIEAVRIWGSDSAAGSNLLVSLIEACLPDFGAAAPTLTTLASATSAGTPGLFTDVANPVGVALVDNQSCTYRVEVRFGPDNSTCDTNLFFSKVRLQWSRVIPPAPALASFTDVPTNAQFFREIEALADTGITAGCTLTEFCPETPVTRRQMAAFLARALGLPSSTIADPANP